MDDEVGTKGSVVFQVWADGIKLYDSGRLTGTSATQTLALDLTGRQQLKLVVTDSGDGYNYDHADWAGARLVPATNPTPPPTTGQTVYLSDLAVTSSTNGYGPVEKDMSNGENGAGDGHVITLNGMTYAKGLGAHASSQVVYNLAGQYKTFASDIGVDDEVGSRGTVVFQVYLDNVKVYDSGVMTGSSATQSFGLDVTGKQQLKLVITDGGDGYNYDHADWAGARLIT